MRGVIFVLLLCGACRSPLTDHGGVLSVDRGQEIVAKDRIASTDRSLRWRAVGPDRLTFQIVPGDEPLPGLLATAAENGFIDLHVRFPVDGSGLAMALLRRRTELRVESIRLDTVLLRQGSSEEFFPVAQMHFEGSISTQRWIDQVRGVESDPAPGKDLLDDLPVSTFRYSLCRGVDRAVSLGYLGGPQSTWELAAVLQDGQPVADWEARMRIALISGYFEAVDGLEAVIRRHAVGKMRGKHYYAVPLSHVLLASALEQDGHSWTWTGLAYVQLQRPHGEAAVLPDGLPDATIRIDTIRNRKIRSGLTTFEYLIVKPLSAAYAWIMGQVLYITDGDAWRETWSEWERQNRKQQTRGQP